MKLLVVIVNYRVADLTIDCLASVAHEVTSVPGTHVAVCENGTGDDSAARLRKAIDDNGWSAWCTLTAIDRNLGFTGGTNVILRQAMRWPDPPHYFLLLNADTIVRPDAFKALVDFMERHPEVGIAGSRLEDPDGTPQQSAFRFQSPLGEFAAGMKLDVVTRLLKQWVTTPPVRNETFQTDWVPGASMIVRRDVLGDIGLLDEGYYTYFDDVDLCFNARKAGWPTWYVPSSRVVHLVGQTTGVTNKKPGRLPRYVFEARRRYFLKNGGALHAAMADAGLIGGLALWRLRVALTGTSGPNAPFMLRDAIRHSVFRTGFTLRDVQNPALLDQQADQKNSRERSLPSGSRPIYYAAAAGDILGTYRLWRDGRRDERQIAATYSSQFFDLCARGGRPGAASYPCADRRLDSDSRFVLRSRRRFNAASGLRFYLQQLRAAAWLFVDVMRTKATDVIVMNGVTTFFLLTPLAWSGRNIFVSVHNLLWRDGQPVSRARSVVWRLDRWFLRHYCAGCLVVSPPVGEQVRELADTRRLPIRVFSPLYERDHFRHFAPPDPTARPFRVFYAGRIEADKGVFDLLEAVGGLVRAGRDICVDYCGEGAALHKLREAIAERGLADRAFVHGAVRRPSLLALLQQAHIVVAPTRSSFLEGLNKVVIEAVLARRPVVTSAICPAMHLIAAAAVGATPDDAESYREAIARLMDDATLLTQKAAAADALREPFFDPQRAWTAQATEMIVNGRR